MSSYKYDSNLKSVPDANITVVLEQALNVEDEYLRLLKLTEGIKYITQKLPQQTTFSSSKLLFQLICLYPFQKANIEILVSTFFEYFQDFRFLNTFYEAAQDISCLQETNPQASFKSRLITLKQNRNSPSNSEGLPFSQKVTSEIPVIKLFSVTYLKRFFVIANTLQLDFQLYCLLFKTYIHHTQNQQIIQNVMDCYQELRHTVFLPCDWANQLSEEIILYFKNTPKLFPAYKKYDIIIVENNSDQSAVSDEQESAAQIQNKRRSYVSSEQDPSVYMQKLCCNQDPKQSLENNSAFEDAESIDILLQFILDPNQIQIIHLWTEHYPKLPDILNPDGVIFKLDSTCFLTKMQVYRSYKALLLLCNAENFVNLYKQHNPLYLKIFSFMSITLNDQTKNLNLYHLGNFLKFILNLQPKFCIKQLIELQLFKKLIEFTYNPTIWQVLFEILDINEDIFQLGLYYKEQLWIYLHIIHWIDFLITKIQNSSSPIQEPDASALTTHLQLLKALSVIDPQRHSKLSKQKTADVVIKDFNEGEQDVDNIRVFLKEQELKKIQQQNNENQANQLSNRLQRKMSNNFYLPRIQSNQVNTENLVKLLPQSTSTQDNQIIKALVRVSPIPRKRNQFSSHQAKNKLKTESLDTELSSNDGFPSSKLISIYPTTKSIIFLSDFERDKILFAKRSITSDGCLKLLIKLMDQALTFAEKQQQKEKLSQKNQHFPIDQLIKEMISEKSIHLLFQIFLYQILDLPHISDSLAIECGILINKIFILTRSLQILDSVTEILKNQFQSITDYLVKIIGQLNTMKSKLEQQQFSFIQYLLVSVLTNGLYLYESQHYIFRYDKQQRSVFRNLTDTLLHIMIIWFSDSYQNQIYQQLFTKFIAIYFAGAPVPYLFNMIFKLGLLSSIYNAYNKFYQNEIKDTSYVEGIFFHILLINYTIRNSIRIRNLTELQDSISNLDSWLLLENAQPFKNTIALQNIDHILNQDLQMKALEQKQEKKTDKNSKFNKVKTQVNTRVSSLVSLSAKPSLLQLSQRQ